MHDGQRTSRSRRNNNMRAQRTTCTCCNSNRHVADEFKDFLMGKDKSVLDKSAVKIQSRFKGVLHGVLHGVFYVACRMCRQDPTAPKPKAPIAPARTVPHCGRVCCCSICIRTWTAHGLPRWRTFLLCCNETASDYAAAPCVVLPCNLWTAHSTPCLDAFARAQSLTGHSGVSGVGTSLRCASDLGASLRRYCDACAALIADDDYGIRPCGGDPRMPCRPVHGAHTVVGTTRAALETSDRAICALLTVLTHSLRQGTKRAKRFG